MTGSSPLHKPPYYIEASVLLGTKPLVDSIRHFIRDPSGVFSVCHLCRILQWRHDSRLLVLLNWFLHIIKTTLHVGSKIWILCSRGKNNISLVRFAHSFTSCHSNIKFIKFSPPCNILSIFWVSNSQLCHSFSVTNIIQGRPGEESEVKFENPRWWIQSGRHQNNSYLRKAVDRRFENKVV